MTRLPVRITTGRPSAARAAKNLGVSKKVLKQLSLLAERSLKTGEFVLPGTGRLVRVHVKARASRNPATGGAIKVAAKKIVKYRVVKEVKGAVVPSKKK